MFNLTSCVLKQQMPKISKKICAESIISRSGEKGKRVNCFSVYIDKETEPYLMLVSCDSKKLNCMKWHNDSYSLPIEKDYNGLEEYKITIHHFYGLSTILYTNIYNYIFHNIFKCKYIMLKIKSIITFFDEYFFRKQKLVTKKRMDLLQFMMNNQLDKKEEGITARHLMRELYSYKWTFHPDGEYQKRALDLYLESLVQSDDLIVVSQGKFVVSGQALITIEKYEEAERKHTESIKTQRKMIFLTMIIIALAVVQSGIVKLKPIFDNTKVVTKK